MGPFLLGYSNVEELYNFLFVYDEEVIARLIAESVNHPKLQDVITDIILKVERVHCCYFIEEMDREESTEFNINLSLLANSYQENDIFPSQLSCFLNSRRALIESLLSAAYELEKNSFTVAVMRLVGLTVGVIRFLSKVSLDRLESYLKISPILGHSIRYLLNAASHFGPDLKVPVQYLLIVASYFGPICVMTSFVEYLRSKYILCCIINTVEEYKKTLEPISNYVSEKDAMQSIVTKIFSQEIDEDVITKIEETMEYLEYDRKIFTAILISKVKQNPSSVKDGNFLCKAYRFSRTEEAYEWYNRMSWGIHLVDPAIHDEEIFINNRINLLDIRVWKDELFHLKMTYHSSGQSIQDIIFFLKPLKLPGFVLFGLHSVCLFYNVQKFNHAKKYMFSNDLRKLASKLLRG
ncbi:uncharacterized protein LOC129964170 isoform X1 [Argiope bruennichi]|uniref:uncharacterized protein LOC129964170 isoform X1 n=2 Tax=Argiope bruennichi TaxID=94029 RepID=UPI002494DA57|nr:uncharacterized protein LOC129964170 isoform X1 [Argiope bruennichi]